MRRWLLPLAFAAPAAADTTWTDPPAPVPHQVSARLDGAVAHLVAEVTLDAHGLAGEPTVEIALPDGAMVTGATAIVGGVAHRLELMPRDGAAKAMEDLKLGDPGAHRAWAVLLAGEGGRGALTVDLVAPRTGSVVLSIELEMPTCFHRDMRYATVPPAWKPALAPGLVVHAAADAVLACNGSDDTVWLGFAAGELAAQPAGATRIGTLAARLPLTADHIAKLEVDLAGKISEVPGDLHTAIVIDASRSVSGLELEAQRAIVEAYLRAAPRGDVQLIGYARTAQALLPGWMPAASAAARIDRALRELPPRNGSNVDAGLAEAAAWLARVGGTHRVIVFTDERLALRFDSVKPEQLKALLPEGTLVHAVSLGDEHGKLEREDDARLAAFAALTEGMAVRGRVEASGTVDATLLARPITLDHIGLRTPGWTDLAIAGATCELGNDMSLPEGGTCSWWGQGTAVAGPITLTGLLWNKPFVRLARPDPRQARHLARELIGLVDLGQALQDEVELAAYAVDHAWSLFATWGGHDGYADVPQVGAIGGGTGGCGCGDGGRSDTFGFGSGGFKLDLRAQLAKGVEACRRGGERIEIAIETTREEIVDTDVGVLPADRAVHDCVVEAVWDTMLAIPNAPEHTTTRFVFDP